MGVLCNTKNAGTGYIRGKRYLEKLQTADGSRRRRSSQNSTTAVPAFDVLYLGNGRAVQGNWNKHQSGQGGHILLTIDESGNSCAIATPKTMAKHLDPGTYKCAGKRYSGPVGTGRCRIVIDTNVDDAGEKSGEREALL
jgi:hypothetical protein